jgi:hypothetical protein
VEPVDEATAAAAAAKHASLHADNVGVDAPADTDLFYRLNIERCFFVGGLGSSGQAEIIPGEVCHHLVSSACSRCKDQLCLSHDPNCPSPLLVTALKLNLQTLQASALLALGLLMILNSRRLSSSNSG